MVLIAEPPSTGTARQRKPRKIHIHRATASEILATLHVSAEDKKQAYRAVAVVLGEPPKRPAETRK